MSRNYYGELFQDWEIKVVGDLIKEAKSKWRCLRMESFNDLLQECLSHWHIARDKFDPEDKASQKTFMKRVIRNKLIELGKKGETDKMKTLSHSISLNKPLSNSENEFTLMDKMAEEEDRSNSLLKVDLRIEITRVLQKLTPGQQKLCSLLSEGITINEASKYFKKHRSNVYRETLRIREVFEREGLNRYLDKFLKKDRDKLERNFV